MIKKILLGITITALLYGCHGVNPLKSHFEKVPPYQKYIRSLAQVELDKTAMFQSWISAGENAMSDSVIVALPFSESGYFTASEPAARAYRFEAKKGQVLTIEGTVSAKNDAHVFLELFYFDDHQWLPAAYNDSTLNLTYEVEHDMHGLIRIQPELLAAAYYTVSISLTPVLINPVAGATNKSIGSFYGDSRDGGKRRHEGVDIFAEKGTPVIAPTDGYVSRVGTGNLGGKVVWLQDKKRGHSYYFAHLDEQLVTSGMFLKKGDTLGTVGNTGNARNTPSHLHFGIYQRQSLDPVHYLRNFDNTFRELPWDTAFQQPDFKVIKATALYTGPRQKLKTTSLEKETYLNVIAQSRDMYRVRLPNDKQGFVPKNKVTPIAKGKRLRIKDPTVLLHDVVSTVPRAHLEANTAVEILASFKDYRFVRTKDGVFGWLII